LEKPLSHTISFRRPELPYVLSTMSVPPEADVEEHVRRLKDLGYKIIAVTPPLDGYGPPQNPHTRHAELRAAGETESPFQSS
jgi:hypothetical protein